MKTKWRWDEKQRSRVERLRRVEALRAVERQSCVERLRRVEQQSCVEALRE